MATQVTTTTREKAERLAALLPTLSTGRSKLTGQDFYLMPSSRPGVVYYSNRLGCTCEGFRNRGACAHQEACRIAYRRADAARIAEAQAQGRPCKARGCTERSSTLTGRCEQHFRSLIDQLGI